MMVSPSPALPRQLILLLPVLLLLLSTYYNQLAVVSATTADKTTKSKNGEGDRRPPPNIILFLADDLGYGEVEGFAPPVNNINKKEERIIKTPNILKLQQEGGIKSTQFYSGEAVCAPARCTLFTGKHTGHATVRGNRKGPDGYDYPLKSNPNDTTIIQLLRRYANYSTGMVGKWCFGGENSNSSPWEKGFDYFYGHLQQAAAHNMYPRYLWGKSSKANATPTKVWFPSNRNATRQKCMSFNNTCQYSHTLFVEKAIIFLEQQQQQQDDNPFFLFVSFTIPHAGGWTGDWSETGNPVPSDGMYGNQTNWPIVERDHAASITEYLDKDIGRILQKLDDLDMANNTVIMFTSDNGPHNEGGHNVNFFNSSGQFRGYKRSLYEGGIRVPFVIKFPNTNNNQMQQQYNIKSTSSDEIGWFPDLYTTIADIAGISPDVLPNDIDGYSLLSLLLSSSQSASSSSSSSTTSESSSSRSLSKLESSSLSFLPPPKDRILYWEFCTNGKWGQAVRQQDWKLINLDSGRQSSSTGINNQWELYNLKNDPSEKYDVSNENILFVQILAQEANKSHIPDPNWPIGRSCIPSDSWERSISFVLDFS